MRKAEQEAEINHDMDEETREMLLDIANCYPTATISDLAGYGRRRSDENH
jgi:hypothetical protein